MIDNYSKLAPVRTPRLPWPKPPASWVALSVDGSFVKESGEAGTGMILRNSEWAVIFPAYCHLFHWKDALKAEIGATLESLSPSLQRLDLPIMVRSDGSTAIASLTDESLDRSAYGQLTLEIKKLLALRDFVPL